MPQAFKVEEEYFDYVDSKWTWFYEGQFGSKIRSVVGQGASGVVLSGEWRGKKAAFKLIKIGTTVTQENIEDNLMHQNNKLSELIMIQETKGSKILAFYGHFR